MTPVRGQSPDKLQLTNETKKEMKKRKREREKEEKKSKLNSKLNPKQAPKENWEGSPCLALWNQVDTCSGKFTGWTQTQKIIRKKINSFATKILGGKSRHRYSVPRHVTSSLWPTTFKIHFSCISIRTLELSEMLGGITPGLHLITMKELAVLSNNVSSVWISWIPHSIPTGTR